MNINFLLMLKSANVNVKTENLWLTIFENLVLKIVNLKE